MLVPFTILYFNNNCLAPWAYEGSDQALGVVSGIEFKNQTQPEPSSWPVN